MYQIGIIKIKTKTKIFGLSIWNKINTLIMCLTVTEIVYKHGLSLVHHNNCRGEIEMSSIGSHNLNK